MDEVTTGHRPRGVTTVETETALADALGSCSAARVYVREHLDGALAACLVDRDRVVHAIAIDGTVTSVGAKGAAVAVAALEALPAMELGQIDLLILPDGEAMALAAEPAPVVSRGPGGIDLVGRLVDRAVGGSTSDRVAETPFAIELAGLSDSVGLAESIDEDDADRFGLGISVTSVDPVRGVLRVVATGSSDGIALLAHAATAGAFGDRRRCSSVRTSPVS
ncbi:hypothetical protein [Ilumatobacter nonamiensis]|uniref:hypothetical protein n=1 Tax=Ilumatobacter nonamiensis TaxID=467093 RepID=UPI00130EA38B|nr:hypothetical protein [Ilumatobacter nonamiensis]